MNAGTMRAARTKGAVLLTGATGFIGTLAAAVLLERERRQVVALVRKGRQVADLAARIRPELAADGRLVNEAEVFGRLSAVAMPPADQLVSLAPELRRLGVTEIVHCAGCMSYFDTVELEQTNILLTDRMLELALALGVERFVYISTAYSSGYVEGPVAEKLHDEPQKDPTAYARTKRAAERHIADSGVPYLIIRPSVVIGDSRTGRYSGKDNGLYQYWHGWERLLLDHYRPETHMVAPRLPVNFVHQDAFQNAFQAAYRHLETGAFFNLTSDSSKTPTVRALCEMWLAPIGRPERCYYYDHLTEVPLDRIPPRQRAFMLLAAVNIGISEHPWYFENGNMTRLRRNGLDFADATRETMYLCQARYMSASPRLRAAMERGPGALSSAKGAQVAAQREA
ncbi:MAG: SDR family oxidoreductase [Alphaproteobacteria bacterium]